MSRRVAGFAFLLFALTACDRLANVGGSAPAPAPAAKPAEGGAAKVVVVSPKKQTLTWSVEQPGNVQAFEVTAIEAKVSGYLKKVNVDIGDEVKGPETVLAELDVPELVQTVAQKKAAVASAQADALAAQKAVEVATAQRKVATAMIAEATAKVARAQADVDRWESELARVEKLSTGGGSVDKQSRDESKRQADAARADQLGAEARVVIANAGVSEADAKKESADALLKAAEARVKVAEADVEVAEAMASYGTLRAPFAGIVTGRFVHTGHLVKASTGQQSVPLFTVVRKDVLRVFVDVPESATQQAVVGASVEIRVPALGNRILSGPDVKVTRTTGVLNTESRTLRTEIDVKNADGTLKPGMYAIVKLTATAVDALVVPPAAVLFADETAYCYAVEDGKATKYRLQVGRNDPTGVQLVLKRRAGVTNSEWQPITGSERVVVGNLGALADGQAVAE